jgi:hypothetical protein
MPSKLGNITFYADDPRRLAHFWASVFHYPQLEWEDPMKMSATLENWTVTTLEK